MWHLRSLSQIPILDFPVYGMRPTDSLSPLIPSGHLFKHPFQRVQTLLVPILPVERMGACGQPQHLGPMQSRPGTSISRSLKAVFHSLKPLRISLTGKSVRVFADSTTVAFFINKRGGGRRARLVTLSLRTKERLR